MTDHEFHGEALKPGCRECNILIDQRGAEAMASGAVFGDGAAGLSMEDVRRALADLCTITASWKAEALAQRLRTDADERRVATEPLPAEYSWLDVRVNGSDLDGPETDGPEDPTFW